PAAGAADVAGDDADEEDLLHADVFLLGAGAGNIGCTFGGRFRRGLLGLLDTGGQVGSLLVAHQLRTLDDGIRNLRREKADGAQRIVIARNYVIHFAGIAVRIYYGNHRNAQFARLAHGDLLFVGVDDGDRIRQATHLLDAGEVS